mmetsp:Transcript_11470/g.16825  ORF Transcript_11470/g.16825 Transcript_11470/m.16825 type:complete len:349 (-) Transcript_11470:85-1131(-)|eukprot:CAMPEP_0194049034 /NCGR_PEP_ID=MMETSP0009_2-20130614/29433_1 /TAXON_ID=210454 /ORGANISM="Grammatophora oceanica, Strain CCMP 410" /LENGTH=348 /DNA_ID=CAMNT_0038695087 /DNA_START=38 /DNA_END=1084 /DNA_ORIENTATION=+
MVGNKQKGKETPLRSFQHSLEAPIARSLLRLASRVEMKKSGLVRESKTVGDRTFHYLVWKKSEQPQRVLFLFHGLSQKVEELAGVVNKFGFTDPKQSSSSLQYDAIYCAEALGHGQDLERVAKHQAYPSQLDILDYYDDFFQHVRSTVAGAKATFDLFGFSLGGAIVYHLKVRHPDAIRKTAILAPSLVACVSDTYKEDFIKGRKNHFAFQDRSDLKEFVRDLCPDSTKKPNPIPKFFWAGILKMRHQSVRDCPDYWHKYMETLLKHESSLPAEFDLKSNVLTDEQMKDVLVLWARLDCCCDFQKGAEFFGEDAITTIEDGGHGFMSDNSPLLFHVVPHLTEFLSETE